MSGDVAWLPDVFLCSVSFVLLPPFRALLCKRPPAALSREGAPRTGWPCVPGRLSKADDVSHNKASPSLAFRASRSLLHSHPPPSPHARPRTPGPLMLTEHPCPSAGKMEVQDCPFAVFFFSGACLSRWQPMSGQKTRKRGVKRERERGGERELGLLWGASTLYQHPRPVKSTCAESRPERQDEASAPFSLAPQLVLSRFHPSPGCRPRRRGGRQAEPCDVYGALGLKRRTKDEKRGQWQRERDGRWGGVHADIVHHQRRGGGWIRSSVVVCLWSYSVCRSSSSVSISSAACCLPSANRTPSPYIPLHGGPLPHILDTRPPPFSPSLSPHPFSSPSIRIGPRGASSWSS